MQKTLYISFTVGALLASNLGASDSPVFRYSLDKSSVLAGDRAALEVRLEVPPLGEDDPVPEVSDDLLMQNDKFLVLQKDVSREQNTMVWKYFVTAYTPKTLTLPPIQVRFGPNTYSTESTTLNITSARGDADQDLREGFGKLSIPIHWKKLIFFLCIAAAILSILRPLLRLVRRLKSRRWRPLAPRTAGQEKGDHLNWLKRELALLKNRMDSEENLDSYVDELTLIIKTYLSRVHDKPVFTMTSVEFAYAFSADPTLRRIHSFFNRCDQFKFAPRKELKAKALALVGIQETERALCS